MYNILSVTHHTWRGQELAKSVNALWPPLVCVLTVVWL